MSGKRKIIRTVALVFALLFAAAAIVQYNDPDPLLWILFYSIAAISCLLFYLNRFPSILGLILGGIYLAGAIWVWPEKFEGVSIGSGAIENIEQAREALGLLIMAMVMFFFSWKVRTKKNQSSRSN